MNTRTKGEAATNAAAAVPASYSEALADAAAMMAFEDGLEPTSALKQAASDKGIPFGEPMDAFVAWARAQWGIR